MNRYLVITMLVCSHVLAADQAPAGAAKKPPIPVFNVNLQTRTSDDTLTFDEQFLIRATVDKNVTGGSVKFGPIKTGAKCNKDAVPASVLFEKGELIPGDTQNELRILTNATVLPNRLHCFVFALDTPVDTPALRDHIKDKLDELTRPLSEKKLTPEQLKTLQKSARDLVEEIATARKATFKVEGGPFDTDAPVTEIKQAFAEDITPIISEQNDRIRVLENYCVKWRNAVNGIIDAQGVATPLLDKIEKLRMTTRAIEAIVSDDIVAFDRLRARDNEGDPKLGKILRADQRCTNENKPGSTLLEKWTVLETASLKQEADKLAKQFGAVRNMIEELRKSKKAAAAVGTDPELATAEEHLDVASVRLEGAFAEIEQLEGTLIRRDDAMRHFADAAELVARKTVSVVGTSTVPYVVRQSLYVSADIGLGTAWDIEESFAYAGVNFYSRAINKNASLDWHAGNTDWWRRRLSAMVGITMQDVERSGEYTGVVGKKGLVTAVGFRLMETLRVSIGGLAVRRQDANPLVDRNDVRFTPFVSFSVDWDVKDSLGKLGSALNLTP